MSNETERTVERKLGHIQRGWVIMAGTQDRGLREIVDFTVSDKGVTIFFEGRRRTFRRWGTTVQVTEESIKNMRGKKQGVYK